MEQYDKERETSFDPNRPLVNQTFYLHGFLEGIPAYSEITETTMKVFNARTFDYVNATYVYNPATQILTITLEENQVDLNFLKLDDNMILYGNEIFSFCTTNGGVGTSLLAGYTASDAGETKTFEFGENNVVNITSNGDSGTESYYVADDNSSDNGEYTAMIDGEMYKVTKENGIYRSFKPVESASPIYTLTPAQ